MQYRLKDIAERLQLPLQGDGDISITGIAPLARASKSELSFFSNPKQKALLSDSGAAAIIVNPEYVGLCPKGVSVIIAEDPYLAFAKATSLFDNSPSVSPGVHPSVVVADSATIAETASIAANVVLGENVVIGEYSRIDANTVVADDCFIGDYCHLHANVSLYHGVKLGNHVTIHSASVIGADGFGFAPTRQADKAWQKIHQLGGVTIGNHVDIGANTCIDRGALDDTVIADGVIIDNQVQIAHNCIIGKNTAIAGCVGIAGSTVIGENCTLAGGVGVAGHLEIVDGVHVTSMSLVTGSIREAGSYSAGTAMMKTKQWRKSAVLFTQLEKMQRQLKKIEKTLYSSSSKDS